MPTFHTRITHHKVPNVGFYALNCRTKADAIMEAQKRFIKDVGLERNDESFCNVEFEEDRG